jgi:hypothetical protein
MRISLLCVALHFLALLLDALRLAAVRLLQNNFPIRPQRATVNMFTI